MQWQQGVVNTDPPVHAIPTIAAGGDRTVNNVRRYREWRYDHDSRAALGNKDLGRPEWRKEFPVAAPVEWPVREGARIFVFENDLSEHAFHDPEITILHVQSVNVHDGTCAGKSVREDRYWVCLTKDLLPGTPVKEYAEPVAIEREHECDNENSCPVCQEDLAARRAEERAARAARAARKQQRRMKVPVRRGAWS